MRTCHPTDENFLTMASARNPSFIDATAAFACRLSVVALVERRAAAQMTRHVMYESVLKRAMQ